jgi:N-acetylmuramoyl-L-alanine amidase
LRRAAAVTLIAFSLCLAGTANAGSDILGMRLWHAPDKTRLVLDLSAVVGYRAFELQDPDRVVIDLEDATLRVAIPDSEKNGPLLQSIRFGQPRAGIQRVVLDLVVPVRFHSFVLPPSEPYGHRLVIDLFRRNRQASQTTMAAPATREADYLVVVDPGHGGEDPGAVGGKGTREKKVVLSIAQRLVKLINSDGRMRAELTRKGDYYVSLRGRIGIAMKRKADLFVSVHADAARRRNAHGASVFVLSKKGASSEMGKWLAQRENATDLTGGIDIGEQEPFVQKAMLDMGLDWKVKESMELASRILDQLKRVGSVHSERVERAGFVVLKSIDIPAVLVETGFITNRGEEKLLRTTLHQERVAGAVYRGLQHYCNGDPRCPRPASGQRTYVVRKGDSLSLIAARYGLTIGRLQRANNLNSTVLQVGQRLQIPDA